MSEPEFLNLDQAAEHLGVRPGTLQKKAAAGTVPGAKPFGRWRFCKQDLDSWLRALAARNVENDGPGRKPVPPHSKPVPHPDNELGKTLIERKSND